MSNTQPFQPAKALILDFGSVVTLTMFETHYLSERALGLRAGALDWMGPFDPSGDKLWAAMQREEITEREYWLTRTQQVGKLLGEEWTEMVNFVSRARGGNPMEIIRPEIAEIVKATVKAGKKLAILSNELDLFYGAEFRVGLDFLAAFDVISDGTYTGILKPNPQAYTACVTSLGLEPADCVFIDDQMRNVTGGTKVGLHAIHLDVRNPRAAFNDAMSRLGIEKYFPENNSG